MKGDDRKDPSKWFYWGRWNQVMLFTSPWFRYPKTSAVKEVGLEFLTGYLKVLHGHYYLFHEDVDKIFEIVQDKLKNEPKWFDKFFFFCDKRMKGMLELENGSDLKKFLVEMHDYLTCSMLVEIFDFGIGKHLKQVCEQEGVSFAEVTRLVSPSRDPLLIAYMKELRKLDKKNIDRFVKKHEWVGTHSFEGEPLTKKKVLADLKHVKDEGKQEKRQEVPKKFKEIIRVASELAFYRSNLMEIVDRVAYSYWDKIAEYGKKKGLSFFDTVSMTHDELIRFIDTGKIPSNLKQRKKRFGIVSISKDKEEILLGKDLDKEMAIHEEKLDKGISELKGIAACNGVVRGQAKILTDVKDVKKVRVGDILIAPETTPDHVMAMRKAAAFVTEIGGLTSHAAIVSREMNTPCVIGTKIATTVFKDGDYVEVDANKGVVKKISKKEYKDWIKDLEKKEAAVDVSRIPLEQLELEISPDLISWFGEVDKEDLLLVGGKGANLGEMFGEFPIPNGFCITVNAYKKFLVQNKLEEKIFPSLKKLDIEKTEELEKESKRVRDLILKADMPEDVVKEILENYKKLKEGFVAVRSSATAEDLPTASFAGQQDTYLNVKGEQDLLDSVKKCWASLFTSRAIYYRVINKFHHEKVLICVVVQEMIDSEKAGVMFSVNPVTADRNEIIIEGNFGLGESVVSGQVTPDSYILTKKPFKIKEIAVNEKSIAIVKDEEKGHSKKIELDNVKANTLCLSEKEVMKLAELGIKIEKHYGKPQDIEWAVGPDKKIYILQSRPITTL